VQSLQWSPRKVDLASLHHFSAPLFGRVGISMSVNVRPFIIINIHEPRDRYVRSIDINGCDHGRVRKSASCQFRSGLTDNQVSLCPSCSEAMTPEPLRRFD